MMLAYQPVRSLATLNMGLNQGIQSARRVLPIIDFENKIKEKENAAELKLDLVIISGLFSISIKPLLMVCSVGVGIMSFF